MTDRQLRLRYTVLTSKTKSEALEKAGYSKNCRQDDILKRAGIGEMFDLIGLTDERLANKASEILDAKTNAGNPDYPMQFQALTLSLKIKGHLKEHDNRPQSIGAIIQLITPAGSAPNRLTTVEAVSE